MHGKLAIAAKAPHVRSTEAMLDTLFAGVMLLLGPRLCDMMHGSVVRACRKSDRRWHRNSMTPLCGLKACSDGAMKRAMMFRNWENVTNLQCYHRRARLRLLLLGDGVACSVPPFARWPVSNPTVNCCTSSGLVRAISKNAVLPTT